MGGHRVRAAAGAVAGATAAGATAAGAATAGAASAGATAAGAAAAAIFRFYLALTIKAVFVVVRIIPSIAYSGRSRCLRPGTLMQPSAIVIVCTLHTYFRIDR